LVIELEDMHRSSTAAHEHRHKLTIIRLEEVGIITIETKPFRFVKKPKAFLVPTVIMHCQPPVNSQQVEQARWGPTSLTGEARHQTTPTPSRIGRTSRTLNRKYLL
jgi:hypothetical protein